VRLELHAEARAELRGAALWYDEQRPGLGDEFIAEISAALDRIGDAPESYPAWPGTRAARPLIRKATVQRFPYLIALPTSRTRTFSCTA
jgi:toxin ParE1/3/4